MQDRSHSAAAPGGRFAVPDTAPGLLLTNFRVRPSEGAEPGRGLLARDGVIAGIGDAGAPAATGDEPSRYDCRGALLLPAFVDAHCHVLATAAALVSVDCSPERAGSIGAIQELLRHAAAHRPAGDGWLRAVGYDETGLGERRHPTAADLDAAVPDVPVRLLHRSGHAVVLNTRAMQLAGITSATPEPPGGRIDRSLETGEPSGLLFEMSDVVDRVVPPLPYEALAPSVAAVSRRYLEAGVGAVCDATATNGLTEWRLFERLQAEGHLQLDVTLMEGIEHLCEMPEAPDARLRRGHVKVMLSEAGGRVTPGVDELGELIVRAQQAGRDVAIHAVEEAAVATALDALEAAAAAGATGRLGHRIEHAALLPPGAAQRMARLGVTAVVQPSWVWHHGDRYLREVPEASHDALHPAGELLAAGVRVAAGTDAPVAPIDITSGVRAAVERRTASGRHLGAGQAVSLETGLRMWTSAAAGACGMPHRGRVQAGAPADLVLLRDGPEVAGVVLGGRPSGGGLP